MGYNNTRTAALEKIRIIAETESDLKQLSFACAAIKQLAEGDFLTGIDDVRVVLAERLTTIINASTVLEDIAYASKALNKLEVSEDDIADSEVYSIGTAGQIGFGVSALRADEVPAGYTLPTGHADRLSPNYGLVIDPAGSYMRFIREFWFRWNGNVAEVRSQEEAGFAKHEAFRHCTIGFLRDTTHVSLLDVGAGIVPIARPNNPPATAITVDSLSGVSTGLQSMVSGIKTYRSTSHHLESLFEANALAVLAKAHSDASPSEFEAAWMDVAPYLPKGNNSGALSDSADSTLTFTSGGDEIVPQSALTASGSNLAKTTHNGQACGVADVNGNLRRANIGVVHYGTTGSIFNILKTDVNPNDITESTIFTDLYDGVDLSSLVSGNLGDRRLGLNTEQVFSTSQAITNDEEDFRFTCAGFPLSTGVSQAGTTAFGNDSIYCWRTNYMIPAAGGTYDSGNNAGVFDVYLRTFNAGGYGDVGFAACVSL